MNILLKISEFKKEERIAMIILLAIISSILVFMIVSFILAFKKKRRSRLKIEQNTRIYVLDKKNNSMMFFDKHNMRKVKSVPLINFFDQFDANSLHSVQSWIDSLLNDPNNTKGFLETNVKVSKNNKTEFVLLEVTSVNVEEEIIHIESHFLPHLSVSSSRHNGQRFLLSYEIMQAKYNSLIDNGKKRGVGLIIRLFLKQNGLSSAIRYNLGALTIQAMNILTPYFNEKRYACLLDINEIFIFDVDVSNRSRFFAVANELLKKINGYLTMNSMNDEYGVCIGAAMFDPSLNKMKTFIANCRDMVGYAEKNEDNSVELYEENSAKVSLSSTFIHSELSSLIHNRTFKYYFTPVISYKDADILAYMIDVVPFGTTFKDFETVVKEASNMHLLLPIYDIIFKDYRKTSGGTQKVIMKVTAEVLNIFLEVAPNDIDKNLILLFDYSQIDLFLNNSDDFDHKLIRLKEKGYSMGLYFEDVPEVNLQINIIKLFDLFVLGGNFANDLKRNRRVQADIILMDALFKTYNKPIIINLKTLGSTEVAFSMGIKYFSCLEFAPASSIFEPLDDKQKKYLVQKSLKLLQNEK